MADKDIHVGDKVQWKYGTSHAQGVAAEIKTQPGEKVQVESKKGNVVTRNAAPENPAVYVERQGEGNNQDVVKKQSELTKVGESENGDADAVGEEDEELVEEERQQENTGEGEKEPVAAEKRDRETAEQAQAGEGKKGEQVDTEKPAEEKTTKEPEAKKAKLGKKEEAKQDKEATAEKASAPVTKPSRSKGRGRAKTTTASTAERRSSGRTKKGAASSKEKAAAATREGEKVEGAVEGTKEVVMGDIPETPGEIEEGAHVTLEAPAGHTHAKDLETSGPSHN